MFAPSTTLSNNDSLLIALFVAVIVHVVLVLEMNFTTPQPEKINKSIDITLINTPAKKEPEKANFLAQENQLGSGEKTKKPDPPAEKLPSQGNSQAKQIKKSAKEVSKPKAAQKIITQQKRLKKRLLQLVKPPWSVSLKNIRN